MSGQYHEEDTPDSVAPVSAPFGLQSALLWFLEDQEHQLRADHLLDYFKLMDSDNRLQGGSPHPRASTSTATSTKKATARCTGPPPSATSGSDTYRNG